MVISNEPKGYTQRKSKDIFFDESVKEHTVQYSVYV